MRQRAFDAGVFVVLPILVLGLAPGAAGDNGTVVEIRISFGSRPWAVARLRMSATRSRVMRLSAPKTKTHSACVAANSRPRLDEPAWYSTGVRCSDGSDR